MESSRFQTCVGVLCHPAYGFYGVVIWFSQFYLEHDDGFCLFDSPGEKGGGGSMHDDAEFIFAECDDSVDVNDALVEYERSEQSTG